MLSEKPLQNTPETRGLTRRLETDVEILSQHLHEGRFQRSLSAVAAMSGLLGGLEVTLEHYKGSYGQRIMYTPIAFSLLLTAAGAAGTLRPRVARTLLPVASALLILDGAIGFGFHIRGVARKPGGWQLPVFNIVMGPPLFAPLLLGVGGFLGLIAARLKPEDSPEKAVAWISSGGLSRYLAGATAVSALLNGFESLYSHYKTGFATPAQWAPVLLSPPLAAVGAGAIYSRKISKTYLPVFSLAALAVGSIGAYFHLRGVIKRPGGRKLLLYNLIYGPPAFAPLLFAATGFMGLLASQLSDVRSKR